VPASLASRESTDFTKRAPRPGRAKTFSMTAEPEIEVEMLCTTREKIKGKDGFRAECKIKSSRLAPCALKESVYILSRFERSDCLNILINKGKLTRARAEDGKNNVLKKPVILYSGAMYPATGNHLRNNPKNNESPIAIKKEGIDRSIIDITDKDKSANEPLFNTEKSTQTNEIERDINIEKKERESVTGSLSAITDIML